MAQRFEGLELLSRLAASGDDMSAIQMLYESSETTSRVGSAGKATADGERHTEAERKPIEAVSDNVVTGDPSVEAAQTPDAPAAASDQLHRQLHGGVSVDEAEVGIYNDVAGADDVSEAATPIKEGRATGDSETGSQHQQPFAAHEAAVAIPRPPPKFSPADAPSNHDPYSPSATVLTRRRPDTAEKIRLRTARLMTELAEIDKFRELRTLSNATHSPHTVGRNSPAKSSRNTSKKALSSSAGHSAAASGFDGSGTNLPPINNNGHRSGGLFSETLAQSKLNLTASRTATANASRAATASPTIGSPKAQTRGDGRAGFSSKESKISGLVQQLTNKWGR